MPFVVAQDPHRQETLDGLDGLLLSGGGDVEPSRYGAADGGLCEGVDVDADA